MKTLTRTILIRGLAAAAIPPQTAFPVSAPREEGKGPDVAPPPAGMGQIVFYRSGMMGALVSCRVREGETVVNRLPPGQYFVHVTTPGAHEYNVRSEGRDNVRLE